MDTGALKLPIQLHVRPPVLHSQQRRSVLALAIYDFDDLQAILGQRAAAWPLALFGKNGGSMTRMPLCLLLDVSTLISGGSAKGKGQDAITGGLHKLKQMRQALVPASALAANGTSEFVSCGQLGKESGTDRSKGGHYLPMHAVVLLPSWAACQAAFPLNGTYFQ